MTTIQTLPETLKYKKYTYTLIKRTKTKCLYKHKDGYEIFKTRVINSKRNDQYLQKLTGKEYHSEYDFKEMFPYDEEFGKRAWYTPSLQRAEEIYNKLS